jgi:tetratricopeptide (TPR) repeat protein
MSDIDSKTKQDLPLPRPKYIPTYDLPHLPSPNFIGKPGLLGRLDTRLKNSVAVVVGIAGVGKTELALQYANKYGRDYWGGCYWLELGARDLDKVLAQHVEEKFYLDLPPEIIDNQTIAQWCWQEWERSLPAGSGKVLVILDDVDDAEQIQGMLPARSSRFRLLVTTRTIGLDETFVEELLTELTDAVALELLEKSIGSRVNRELDAAQRLCRDLMGNLPLGIELVGHYLAQHEQLTITNFSYELAMEQEALDVVDTRAVRPNLVTERGVKSAFEMSWRRLSPDIQTVAKFLGLCAPREIPWELVTKMARSGVIAEAKALNTPMFQKLAKNLGNLWKSQPKQLASSEARAGKIGKIEQAREQLESLHFIKWNKESKTATLHPFIHFFCQQKAQTSPILQQVFADTMLQRARQATQDMNLSRVYAMSDIIPHIEEVALHYSHLLSDNDFIWPFVGISRFYDTRGLYAASEPWYALCLEKTSERLGETHPRTATSLNNLAGLHDSRGNYAAALPLYQRALQIRQEQVGANHPDIATNLNNLAYLYESMERYEEAESLYAEALKICERSLRFGHPHTAIIRENYVQFLSRDVD